MAGDDVVGMPAITADELRAGIVRSRMDEATRAAAIRAVNDAMAAYEAQAWYRTVWARIRFAAYWVTYSIRRRLGVRGYF